MSHDPAAAANEAAGLCDDCPPIGYVTDATRCLPCPRRPIKPMEILPSADAAFLEFQERITRKIAAAFGGVRRD